jgi:hypothetical protein
MKRISEELADLMCEGCKSYAISLLEMKKIGAGYWQMRARDSTMKPKKFSCIECEDDRGFADPQIRALLRVSLD